MKQAAFLLLTALSLLGWQRAAQAQNTTCANAQAIALSEEINTPQGEHWYKLSATAGKSYWGGDEINGYFSVYSSCGGNQIADGNVNSNTFAFTATATQDYYISAYNYSASSTWSVSEITDNRACAYAEAITLNSTVSSPKGMWWYKLSATEGQSYGASGDGINGSFYVYSSCGGNQITSGNNTFAFTATASQDYYIQAYSGNTTNTWSVGEITDNRVCAYAEAITLNSAITTPQDEYRWYKLSAAVGKSYGASGDGISGHFFVYASCDDYQNGEWNNITYGNNTFGFTATASQDYYIRAYVYNTNTWSVSEITDNRACGYAEAITPGDTITTPQSQYLWYKFPATAGTTYEVDGSGMNADYIYIYSSCNGSTVTGGNGKFTFVAPATQDYYIRIYGYDETNRWVVSQVTDNRICEYATPITLGDTVDTEAQYQYRWYKLSATIGESYEVDGSGMNADPIYIFSSCSSGSTVAGNYGKFTFVAPATRDYYFRIYGREASNRWLVTQVTDNRLCAYAEAITLGAEIATEAQNEYRWYKLQATAGASYEVDGSQMSADNIYIYSSCGGGNSAASGYGKFTFTAPATQDYYLRIYGYNTVNRWLVTQITDNRVCANATAIVLGDTIATEAQNEYRWYKLAATEGASYEVDGSGMNADYISIYSSCGNQIGGGNGRFTFTAPATRDYYLRIYGYDTENRWLVTHITDNRLCAYAENITPGDTIATPQGQDRWYKLAATAGKSYGVSGSGVSVNFYVYSSCGGNQITSGDGAFNFTAAATQDYYISAYGNDEVNRWVVSEVTDNRVCANATLIAPSANDTVKSSQGERWYKFSATAGATYEVDGRGASGNFYVYSSCGGSQVASGSGGAFTFTATATQSYYIRANGYGETNRWLLSEVADNRACDYAAAIALGDTATYAPRQYRWYRVQATAGKSYAVSSSGGSLAAYASCGGSQMASGSGAITFTATATQRYYLRAYGYSDVNLLSVSEVDNNVNNICSNAEAITLNTEVTTEAQNQYRWYKLPVTAGATYEVDGSQMSGEIYVYSSCGSSYIAGGGGTVSFTASATQDYYIRIYGYSTTNTWLVRQFTDNTICSNAEAITLGDTITTAAQYEYRWYKLSATAGASYEVDGSSMDGYIYVYSSCDGGSIASVGSYGKRTFTASATQDYYLRIYGYSSDNRWLVTLFTDNTICGNAEAITLNDTVTTPAQNQYRWYKLSATEGDSYEVDGSGMNCYIDVYSSCGGGSIAGIGGYQKLTFTATATQDYYIRIYDYNYGDINRWLVTRVTDNRACGNAIAIAPGDTVSSPQSEYRWYKLSAIEGASYGVSGDGINGNFYVYSACNGSQITGGNNTFAFTAAATQDYYIRVWGNNQTNKWSVSQATDNRACAFAVATALGDTVTTTERYEYRWYKFPATEGVIYEVDGSEMNGEIYVYPSCGDDSYITGGYSRKFTFTATATQDYYLRVYGNNILNRWSVSQVTDNRVCAYADAITPGATVSTEVRYEYRWYKLSATAGASYEVDGSSMSGNIYVYSSCDGPQIASTGGGKLTFTATAAQDYYIRVYGNNIVNRWSVSQVTDNRACTYAEAITPGSVVTTTAQNQYRWYKLAVTSGETYEVDGSEMSGNIYVYSSCDGVQITGGSGKRTFTATATQDYYISVYGYNAANTWSARQVTDNTICAYAEAITLGATVTTTAQNQYRWYKFPVTSGASYEVDVSGMGGSYSYVYSSCNTQIAAGSGKFTLTATATQDYYIRVYGNNAVNTWSVSQITDNRVCANAEAITPGSAVNTPQSEYRWYKLQATEGKTYGVDGNGVNGNFYIITACTNGTSVASGSGVVTFTATATQDYYIRVYGNDAVNSWSMSEVTATDNRVCAGATPIALNVKVPVSATGRWYGAPVQAGKWYSVSVGRSGSSVVVYIGCDGGSVASGSGTTYFYAAGNATANIRYSNAYSATVTDTLTIREGLPTDVANTTCAAARSITAGQTVVHALPAGQYGYYKLAVEAGKSYEIPRNDVDGYFYVLTGCSGSTVANGNLYNGITFAAEASGEYIIRMYAYSSGPVEWQVNEVSASVSCAVAQAVTAGVTVQAQGVSTGVALWYKLTPTEGKTYRITSTSSYSVSVYDDCSGSQLGSAYGDTLIFTAASGSSHYIRWEAPYSGSAPYEFEWSVSEYTPPAVANATCATAQEVELNTYIPVLLTGAQRWYKFEATAGKYYRIYKSSASVTAAVYTACGQATPAATDEGSEASELVYHAAQGGDAYISLTGSGSGNLVVREAVEGEVCETATPIAVNESVLSDEYYTERWYSLQVEPGYLYTVSNAFSTSYIVAVYDGCGGNELGYAIWVNQLTFSVTTAKTCYIRYNNQQGSNQEWRVSRSLAEGNTVCSNAEPAQLNTSTNTTVEAGKTYWYSFFGEAGKVYELSDCGGADFDTELRYGASCEELSNHDGGCNGYMQERLIVQGEGKLVYFGWKAYGSSSTVSGSITWTVTEVPADNQLCAYADYVRAGDTVRSALGYDVTRWYQFTAQAGKIYEVVGAGNSSSYSAQLSVLSGTCDSADVLASGYSSLLFQPEQTAAYYITCSGSSSSDYAWRWQVREVTDNRVCANAATVAAGEQVGNTHTGSSTLWHAFTAPAAGQYDITAPAGQQLRVWTGGCGESRSAVATGYGSVTFAATAGATYYVEWIATASYTYSYTWSVGPHASAALTALSVLSYPLSPAFAPQVAAYSVNVPNSEATVTIAATAPSGVTVTGDVGERSVSVGSNSFTVTASAGSDSIRYAITVRRAALNASSDAALSTLTVSAGSLTPEFSADVTSYAVSVENTVSSIVIGATAAHAEASVNGAGTFPLTVGAGNNFQLTVIAEDGTQRSYTIAVTRAAPVVVETPEVLTVTVTPSTVSLQAGAQRAFTANVAVVGGAAQTVRWSVSGNTSASTIIASGMLIVGANETATTLTVTATSTFDNTKSGTATVTVILPEPEVFSVAVSPNPVSVQKGTTQPFSANVTATGGAAQTVRWSVSGNASSSTTISAAGLLTVAADETAVTLTVTATSTVNTAKSGTATVAVTTEAVAPEVISVTVTSASGENSVQKGKTLQLTATVSVVGGAAQTVTWSVSGNNASGTMISAAGLLTVSANETATELTVTATSTVNTEKSNTVRIGVTTPPFTVTGVTVSPATVANMKKGATQQFTAAVAGTAEAGVTVPQDVTWSVSGNSVSGTTISAAGLLTVAADETATTLTVTATSVFDITKSGTATVTVTAPTGVNNQLTVAASLYPNPFADELHLAGAEGCTLRVISASGATVYTRLLTSTNEVIRLENLPSGLYFFQLEKGGKTKTLQAAKQ